MLCDFGGSGSSITLVDAGADDAPIGQTVRVPDFSGDQIDQAVLAKVVAEVRAASDADPAGTAVVGSLSRLRAECRAAKERLSDETATRIAVDLPGLQTTVRMTRTELETLIDGPLTAFIAVLVDTLQRNRIPPARVTAVATVGGGARIPLITQRLSEHLRASVVTTPQPQFAAADGAALIAHRGQTVETATAMAPAAPATATVAAAAFAGGGAPAVGALAWSEVEEIEDRYVASPVESRPEVNFRHDEWEEPADAPRRSPVLLLALAGAAVVVAAAVFGLTALTRDTTAVPAGTSAGIAPAPAPVAEVPAPAADAPAPAQAPEVTTVLVRPQPQVASRRQQQPPAAATAPQPAPQPAPAEPAPAPPAPQPAPAEPAPAPAPENPAPPSDPGTGTPPSDPGAGSGTGTGGSGTGTSTGGSGTGTGGGTGAGGGASSGGTGAGGAGGTGTGTGSGADAGTGSGSTGSAKTPLLPGLIPILQPGA